MSRIKMLDATEQIRGVSYKPEDVLDGPRENAIGILRANNISDGVINFNDLVFVKRSKVLKKQILRKGDILICASSGSKHLVGKAAQIEDDCEYSFGAFCKVVRPQKINALFLGMYFQSALYRRYISGVSQGANINNIKNEHIDSIEIQEYSDAEQVKIAELLQMIISIIRLQKEQIKKYDELIKSRFVEMFGDPMSNPMGWDKKPLANECDIVTGNTPSRKVPEYYGDYIEWIKSDNINTPNAILTTAEEYLSEEGLKVGRSVDVGAILMTCIAGSIGCIGNVAIANRTVSFNQQINGIVPKKNNTWFMYVLFELSKSGIQSTINMALKGILSKGQLAEMEFIFPPAKLQKEFGDFVEQIDKLKVVKQKRLEKLQLLFDSLMQQYFS